MKLTLEEFGLLLVVFGKLCIYTVHFQLLDLTCQAQERGREVY